MASLPDLKALLREKVEANNLMLASTIRWELKCACGAERSTTGNGMPAAYSARAAGWRFMGGKPVCPGCAEMF